MAEKETGNIRKKAIDDMAEHYKNTPPWSPLRDIPNPDPRIICGACGEVVPHGTTNHDIMIIHHCKADHEYLATMKKIAFKLLGMEDPEYQMLPPTATPPWLPQMIPIQNPYSKEEMDKAREEVFKEFGDLNKEFQKHQTKKAKK